MLCQTVSPSQSTRPRPGGACTLHSVPVKLRPPPLPDRPCTVAAAQLRQRKVGGFALGCARSCICTLVGLLLLSSFASRPSSADVDGSRLRFGPLQ